MSTILATATLLLIFLLTAHLPLVVLLVLEEEKHINIENDPSVYVNLHTNIKFKYSPNYLLAFLLLLALIFINVLISIIPIPNISKYAFVIGSTVISPLSWLYLAYKGNREMDKYIRTLETLELNCSEKTRYGGIINACIAKGIARQTPYGLSPTIKAANKNDRGCAEIKIKGNSLRYNAYKQFELDL